MKAATEADRQRRVTAAADHMRELLVRVIDAVANLSADTPFDEPLMAEINQVVRETAVQRSAA